MKKTTAATIAIIAMAILTAIVFSGCGLDWDDGYSSRGRSHGSSDYNYDYEEEDEPQILYGGVYDVVDNDCEDSDGPIWVTQDYDQLTFRGGFSGFDGEYIGEVYGTEIFFTPAGGVDCEANLDGRKLIGTCFSLEEVCDFVYTKRQVTIEGEWGSNNTEDDVESAEPEPEEESVEQEVDQESDEPESEPEPTPAPSKPARPAR